MTLRAAAEEKARVLDGKIEAQLADIRLSHSRNLLAELRAYLDKQDRSFGVENNVINQLKMVADPSGVAQINLGMPSRDRTSAAFSLRSGSRLTFGITVRDAGAISSLLSYRFQMQLPERYSPEYLRFDLIPKQHDVPLREARCHLHPGAGDIRLPIPPLSPFEVLDRVFFVIEPSIQ